jgi:Protein of unknown function (DUF1236)
MSRKILLVSVAATALIAGGSLASAQGMNQKSDAPKAQETQKAPDSAQKPAQSKSQTTGQAPREGQGSGQMQREGQGSGQMQREEGQSGQRRDGTTGQRQEGQQGQQRDRQEGQQGQQRDRQEGQQGQQRDRDGQRQGQQDRQDGQRQGQQDRQDGQRQGQAGRNGGTQTQLTSEQRTKISSVVKSHSEARVSNVNFSVSVGTVVPRTVRLVALPEEVIVIHPAWRGFRFFIVNEQIVIVEPDTLRIVAVLPA